jgi:hypothetical protein
MATSSICPATSKGRSEALVTGVLSLTDYLQTRVSGRKKEVGMRQTIVATGIHWEDA